MPDWKHLRGCLCVSVLMWGCAHAPPSAVPELDGDQGTPSLHALADQTARLRGLTPKRPLRFGLVSTEVLRGILRQRAEETLTAPSVEATGLLWSALGVLAPGQQVRATLLDVVGEHPTAFYDRVTKVLWVVPFWETGGEESAAWLVHEVDRALLDERFPQLRADKAPHDDVKMARASLLEGDAMLTMMAWLTEKQGRPLAVALPGIAAAVSGMPVAGLLRMTAQPESLMNAPGMLRDLRLFPSTAGLQLVAEVYGLGGFELVNRMYEHPPQSSHQVLHVEKYLVGDAGVAVAAPVLPEGVTPTAAGVLGEVGARSALQVCHPQKLVGDVVLGLNGDAWRLGKGRDGKPVMVWVTSWEKEKQARMAEFLLNKSVACLEERARAGDAVAWMPSTVSRRDRVVVWTRGLDTRRALAFVGQWTGGVGQPASPTPPLGAVAPRALATGTPEGHVDHGVWTSEWLGLSARLPPDFEVQPHTPGVELMLRRQQPAPAAVTVAWVRSRVRQSVVPALFTAMAERLTGNGPPLAPSPLDNLPTPLGLSLRQRFVEAGGERTLTLLAVPWCGGRSTLVLALLSTDATGESAERSFLDGMSVLPDAPACR